MRVFSRLTIRSRLTIGTMAVAVVLFTVSAVVVHVLIGQLVQRSSTDLLKSDIAPYVTALKNEPHDEADVPSEGHLIAVISPDHSELVSSLPPALSSHLSKPYALRRGTRNITDRTSTYLVSIKHVSTAQGTWTIVGARDQSTTRLLMSRLDLWMMTGVAALVLVFGLLSWFLISTALRPVERLRQGAERVLSDGGDGLLPVAAPNDEIHDLAATLNRLITQLRSSAARERQMVSDASHELRTPLALLQGQLELLRKGDRKTLDQDIAEAERASARLSKLATNLLTLSRLDAASSPQVHTGPSEILDETGEAVDRARLSAADRQVDIDLSIGDLQMQRGVCIDRTTFGQIVDNLLANAIHAVDDHGQIEVFLNADQHSLHLTVRDNGTGIPEDFIAHAFDRFARSDVSRGRSQGTGLGLAIVASAVSASGGSVSLTNREDSGVLAEVTLPLSPTPHGV